MDIDLSQWVNHAISLIFGSAGGIGATFARFNSSVKALSERLAAVEKQLEVSKEREKDRAATIEALQEEIAKFRDAYGKNQSEVERSLGAIEGTVNMIAKNGCANRCVLPSGPRYPSGSTFPAGGTKR